MKIIAEFNSGNEWGEFFTNFIEHSTDEIQCTTDEIQCICHIIYVKICRKIH